MKKYSDFFQTLYDQQTPVGSQYPYVHYSVLRAIVFKEDQKAYFHDFAVIWDSDHDERVIYLLELLYCKGLLPYFTAIGERKGGVTIMYPKSGKSIEHLNKIREVINREGVVTDRWMPTISPTNDPEGLYIDGKYLEHIDILWSLGSKDTEKYFESKENEDYQN
jgi:hypothetical protein